MPTATIQSNSQIGGLSIAGTVSRSGDGQLGFEIALPAGESFYMGTRTDDNTGYSRWPATAYQLPMSWTCSGQAACGTA